MKLLIIITFSTAFVLKTFGVFGQSKADLKNIVLQYAEEANRLDLQTNPDSIDCAYNLHSKILILDKKYTPSYRSKISIEYKKGKLNDALNSAIAFVTNLPDLGDAWVYLGLVQNKLNDTNAAKNSFVRAIETYKKKIKEVKNKNWESDLRFQIGIVEQLLTNEKIGPAYTYKNKTGVTTKVTLNIGNTTSVEDYVETFMTYNGLQFF